jgi:hypothetical protein
MNDKESKQQTADGFPIILGGDVWIKNDVEGREPFRRIVGVLKENKIIYATRIFCFDSEKAAKLSSVFKIKSNAYWDAPTAAEKMRDRLSDDAFADWKANDSSN